MHEIIRKNTNRRMSQIVIYSNVAYFCGQVAKEMVPNVKLQTATTLEKIDELLVSINLGRKEILSATVYLKDMTDFNDMNEVWEAWIPEGHAPVRTCVEAKMSRDEILVEVTITAAAGLGH